MLSSVTLFLLSYNWKMEGICCCVMQHGESDAEFSGYLQSQLDELTVSTKSEINESV